MSERIPLRRAEYTGLMDLIGAVESSYNAMEALGRRAEAVPGAMDQLRQGHDLLIAGYRAILRTVPEEKLRAIDRDLANIRIYVKVEAPGLKSMDTATWRYIRTSTVNRLVDYVANHECFFCDKSKDEARACPVRRMMEDALPHELEYAAPDGCCKWSGITLGLEGAAND